MPDAFFATQKNRKRKRTTASGSSQNSKKFARTGTSSASASANGKQRSAAAKGKTKRKDEDEELESGSGSDVGGLDDMDLRVPDRDEDEGSGEEIEDETPAEKRLRLAKLYLDSVKEGMQLVDGEYDAAEIDRELISARLKQDVLEHSGKVHLFVADNFDFSERPSNVLRTRGHRFSVTSAVASEDGRMMFTAGKEGSIIKWDLKTGKKVKTFHKLRPEGKGKGKEREEVVKGHTDEVLALALSGDGKYLASGGKDRKVVVWDAEKGEWVKSFGGHKDTISALSFRKSTHQLYTASFDRTLKLFDLSVMGYVETLFGHQDTVLSLDALKAETAVSSGGRDRTVRFWKVVEESQLVFRGGGRSKVREVIEGGALEDEEDGGEESGKKKGKGKDREREVGKKYVEGSIDCVAMIDEATFVSGGDSGSICLWTTQKKKPIFTQPVAHGLHEVHSETEGLIQTPRWVTSVASLRYADMFASGSWEGSIRIWKLDAKLKAFSLFGTVPAPGIINSLQFVSPPKEAFDDFSWARSPGQDPESSHKTTNGVIPNGKPRHAGSQPGKGPVMLVAGVGQEMKFGRWLKLKGEDGVANCAFVWALRPRTLG